MLKLSLRDGGDKSPGESPHAGAFFILSPQLAPPDKGMILGAAIEAMFVAESHFYAVVACPCSARSVRRFLRILPNFLINS
jgi:hypothetical protein